MACAGSERENPGDVRGAEGTLTIREDLGPGFKPGCVGCLDPRVGKEAGSEKKRSRTVVRVGRVSGRGR